MKFKFLKGAAVCALAAGMVLGAAGCGEEKSLYNNDVDPIVFSTEALDGVFSPFFATSGTDSAIASMTQIGMLANDENANVVFGENEAVAALDFWQVASEDMVYDAASHQSVPATTTYYFALKNDIKFSDGSPLTIKDVLFNFYVYLDPAYYGSNTIYSTDIVGLKEYRTQQDSESGQEYANKQFEDAADGLIDELYDIAFRTFNNKPGNSAMTSDEFRTLLASEASVHTAAELQAAYDKALEFFREELESDWSNSLDSYEDTKFTTQDGITTVTPFTTDVEVFLYNEGYLYWDTKEYEIVDNTGIIDEIKTSWDKEDAIDYVYNGNIPSKFNEVLTIWSKTPTSLYEYEVAKARQDYYANKETLDISSIEGIKFANRDQDITNPNNNKTYAKIGAGANNAVGSMTGAENYNTDGSPKAGFNEVLSITINKVDPQAVWNFGIGIAPMWYYSDKAHCDKFDYETNFGVQYGSRDFMDNVVKAKNKVGVPVGAGPYAASTAAGGIGTRAANSYGSVSGVDVGTFYDNNIVYFEKNPYFNMANTSDGTAKIKKVRFQVESSSTVKNALQRNEIDFGQPKADNETANELKGMSGIGSRGVRTNGYGYIGVNAGKVPELKIRQAIMHSINVQTCVDYYKGTANLLTRSMSSENWASPDNDKEVQEGKATVVYYPAVSAPIPKEVFDADAKQKMNPDYVDFVLSKGYSAGDTMSCWTKENPVLGDQEEFIMQLVAEAGYVDSGKDAYIHSEKEDYLRYNFTVVGNETDHPAWNALIQAGQLLNRCGFAITTKTDAQGLSKLGSGDLTVWAAAWGSTLDPDMYQVYHRDSETTSVYNWGYREIKSNRGGRYGEEAALLDLLATQIELGRKFTEQKDRKQYYYAALDLVMQLAIELPTYQRDDLFAWNDNKIDSGTFNKNVSAFLGLTSEMQNISLRIS